MKFASLQDLQNIQLCDMIQNEDQSEQAWTPDSTDQLLGLVVPSHMQSGNLQLVRAALD